MNKLVESYWQQHSQFILESVYNLVLAAIVVISCLVLAKIFRKAILKANQNLEQLDETFVPVLCAISKYMVYLIGLIIVLDIFGVNTTSIVTILGTAGLAIGFALKDTLSNIAAGIMLLLLRPFRLNDFVEFGTVTGKVKEINLFTTIVESPDGLYICSPNSTIWGNSITNYTRNGTRRLDVSVGISYSDSIDKALAVLKNIADTESRLLSEPPTQTILISMGDSSINLQLRAWARVDDYWQTLWDLNKRVKEEIEGAGLSIPFPQRDLHIVKSEIQ